MILLLLLSLGPLTSEKMYDTFEKMVSSFHESYEERVEQLSAKHFADIKTLLHLRKNYERLLLRTGFEKKLVVETFEKKRKKDTHQVVKDHRRRKYEYMLEQSSTMWKFFNWKSLLQIK